MLATSDEEKLLRFSELSVMDPMDQPAMDEREDLREELESSMCDNGQEIGDLLEAFLAGLERKRRHDQVAIAGNTRNIKEDMVRVALTIGLYQNTSGSSSGNLFARCKLPSTDRIVQGFCKKHWNIPGVVAAALRCRQGLRTIAGADPAIKRLRRDVWRACFGNELTKAVMFREQIRKNNVLILGPTGSGKSMVADIIADSFFPSSPHEGDTVPYGSVNISAFADELLPSELFGHEKGSFSGAVAKRLGLFQSCHNGVVFLDEIGDLPKKLQSKILRSVEENKVRPVGSDKDVVTEVRCLSATHRLLDDMVESGEFREDLYQRLAGVVIHTPAVNDLPLEDRVYIAASAVGGDAAEEIKTTLPAVLQQEVLRDYPWPGNSRELAKFARNFLLSGETKLTLRQAGPSPREEISVKCTPVELPDEGLTLRQVEDWYIARTLEKYGWNRRQAATAMDISYSKLLRRLRD